MKFTRINKDTVNCIITEDDLDEQGIKLEDLFERKKEAMDFLHEVVERASEEVDLDNLVIEDEFGFTVHHGMNRLVVTGSCCKMACVYIDVDELTN